MIHNVPLMREGLRIAIEASTRYPEAKVTFLPADMPAVPGGGSVVMSCFVEDADHVPGFRVSRRSHTGVINFCEPLSDTSMVFKRQNTVESAIFGSEFVVMRIAIEIIEGLRYKLRMMGVGIDGPCNVF